MTWKFLSQENGINRYEITMRIYRNCNDSAMDIFDLDAPISVFREDCSGIYQTEQLIPVALLDPTEILQQDTSICRFLPSDICMEVGIYRFEIELPVIIQDYTIVYQRCCRPNFISNMAEPDRTGISISTAISREAQQLRLSGKLVHQEVIDNNVHTINLDQLSPSLYLYTINQDQLVIKQGKLIVK